MADERDLPRSDSGRHQSRPVRMLAGGGRRVAGAGLTPPPPRHPARGVCFHGAMCVAPAGLVFVRGRASAWSPPLPPRPRFILRVRCALAVCPCVGCWCRPPLPPAVTTPRCRPQSPPPVAAGSHYPPLPLAVSAIWLHPHVVCIGATRRWAAPAALVARSTCRCSPCGETVGRVRAHRAFRRLGAAGYVNVFLLECSRFLLSPVFSTLGYYFLVPFLPAFSYYRL